jgi:3'-phosphoadenosine 5'-phosphosulfate (PAPS) 3'-phosphatase
MDNDLPLPAIRCLSKSEAATYLGIGLTLFNTLDIPAIKFGRRSVYDVVDLDAWLMDYKQRGRARKDELWLNNKTAYIVDPIQGTGGLMQHSQTAKEYAKVLGLNKEKKPKPI